MQAEYITESIESASVRVETTAIESITLRRLHLPLKFVFRTAKATVQHREVLVVQVKSQDEFVGYGECVAFTNPFYTTETIDLAWAALKDYYIPYVLNHQNLRAKELIEQWDSNRFSLYQFVETEIDSPVGASLDSPMAISSLENALLHIECQRKGVNTVSHIMKRPLMDTIPSGVVIGDIPIDQLVDAVQQHVNQGCKRIKLKVTPTDGVERASLVRHAFPDLPLAVDGNGSFPFSDLDVVAKFDELNLCCLEEIFHMDSLMNYGKTVKALKEENSWPIKTSICLDESVLTVRDLQFAIAHHCVDVLNIKIGRFGGLYHTKSMMDLCDDHGIGYWIGSMVESSISKMMHVQLAAFGNMFMLGDLSDSVRYFERDLTQPDLTFTNGIMTVPNGPGLGVIIDESLVHEYTVESLVF